jgi:glycosyltransferase involved in cell wall biosynthesis
MIKVCHISTVHGAFDDRIFYKECVSLAQHGYDVSLVVQHDKNEMVDGVKIQSLPKFNTRNERFIKGSVLAYKKAKATKSKIYHFHDPELIIIGIFLKISGKKVIYDVHENVSKQIKSKTWIKNIVIRKIVAFIYKLVESFGVLFFDKVVTVIPEIANEFPQKKSVVIRNLPILKLVTSNVEKELNNTTTTIVYAGGLTRNRGLKETIISIEKIEAPVKFLIIGEWLDMDYYEECKQLKGWGKVNYIGKVKLEEVYKKMSTADIGMALLYPEENYLRSLPVKAFEYMACGLPIVMSDFPYWMKTFKKGALFVNPFDDDAIFDKLNLLIGNKELRNQIGVEGKCFVHENFSWEKEVIKLIAVYKDLLKK